MSYRLCCVWRKLPKNSSEISANFKCPYKVNLQISSHISEFFHNSEPLPRCLNIIFITLIHSCLRSKMNLHYLSTSSSNYRDVLKSHLDKLRMRIKNKKIISLAFCGYFVCIFTSCSTVKCSIIDRDNIILFSQLKFFLTCWVLLVLFTLRCRYVCSFVGLRAILGANRWMSKRICPQWEVNDWNDN